MLVWHRPGAALPVIIAGNRDEFYQRHTAPPGVVSRDPLCVAGRDLVAGGTWFGVTGDGFVAAVTNLRGGGRQPDRRSRGQVVMSVLEAGSVSSAGDVLAGLPPGEYNPFQLLYGTAEELWVAYSRPDVSSVAIAQVPPGFHVLANDVLDSEQAPEVARVAELWSEPEEDTFAAAVERMAPILADHALPAPSAVVVPKGAPYDRATARALQAICVHTELYGTRSVTVVALEPGRVAHYLYADGPLCRAELVDVTDLLER